MVKLKIVLFSSNYIKLSYKCCFRRLHHTNTGGPQIKYYNRMEAELPSTSSELSTTGLDNHNINIDTIKTSIPTPHTIKRTVFECIVFFHIPSVQYKISN